MEQVVQNLADEREALFHPEGKGLDRELIVEPVYNEPREEVPLTVDEAVGGFTRVQPLAEIPGRCDSRREKVPVDLDDRTGEKPESDQRVGVVQADPERKPARRHELDYVADGGASPGFADFVAECPGVTGDDAPFLLVLENDLSCEMRLLHAHNLSQCASNCKAETVH